MMRCPRKECDGAVGRAAVPALGVDVYVCDRCDALWTHREAVGAATFVSLPLFLQSHGLAGDRAALGPIDANWDGSQRLDELRAAVEASPEDVPTRLIYAGLLLEGGQLAPALEQFAAALAREPDSLAALRGAARAAAELGDEVRADRYRRLLGALAATSQSDPAPPAPAPPAALPTRAEAAPADDQVWRLERSTVRLADVAGMAEVKRRLEVAFLGPLRNPELRTLYGKSLRGGLLLFGPPGCGKTFIARAIAGDLGAQFLSVELADVLDMWLGNSEKQLHAVFELARRNAPSVVFFDEVDALGQRRSQRTHQAGRDVVNQLLADLDGVGADNEGVFTLAATNHPWDVDPALLRPGRLDRTLLVLPPDRPAREAILAYHLRGRPTEQLDLGALAERTDGFSGADLAHLCDSAAELALADSVARGTARPIRMDDLRAALKELRPSTRAWFDTARNYAMFANQDGRYDHMLEYMRAHKLL